MPRPAFGNDRLAKLNDLPPRGKSLRALIVDTDPHAGASNHDPAVPLLSREERQRVSELSDR